LRQSAHHRRLGLISAVILTMAAETAHAAPVTVPAGLNPGDQYRLVFITAGSLAASSTGISTYDTFVTTEADSNAALLALATTWVAIGSTATVNAFDHIGGTFTIPVYNLAGSLVATGASDLWDGSLGAPIKYDESGDQVAIGAIVWTGTGSNGQKTSNPLGYVGTPPTSTYGNPSSTGPNWAFNGAVGNVETFEFYAISGTLTVPAAVPEPGTVGMVGLALATLAGLRRYRSRPK